MQSEYEIIFYVPDGCLKREILLHDKFVEKFLGYSAMELYRATSSYPTVNEDIKRLQLFLNYFQGMMVVEMNRASQYPVAIEMIEGCSLTDAESLFQRFTSSTTPSSSINPVIVLPP